MVDLEKLNQKIDNAGLKKVHIAKKCGYSPSSFTLKLQGKRKITVEDINNLKKVLKLSERECREIFFD